MITNMTLKVQTKWNIHTMAYRTTVLCFALLVAVISTERVLNTITTQSDNLPLNIVKGFASDADLSKLVLRLANELKDLQRKVLSLEKLETRVEELEKQLNKKCGEISDDNVTGNAQIDDDDENEPPDIEIHNRIPSTDNRTVNIRRGIRQTQGPVAFSVVVSRPLSHIQKWQVIKFDKTILNTGNGYNATSGVFTPPTSGTYLFLYHLGHYGDGETWVEFMKNGESLNGVGLKGTAYNQYLQGSNSVVTHMELGDAVWVESYHVPDASVQGEFTTFSGVLLN